MGQTRRQQPARLPAKLREVRTKLGLTQEQMAERLHKVKATLQSGHISEFEMGKREPSLNVLLHYARVAVVPMEVLVDDDLDLPDHLPGLSEQYMWVMKRMKTEKKHP